MQPPRRRDVTLVDNVEVGPGLHVLEFTVPPSDPIEFSPGQYVTFYLLREGKRITRSYSIFSSGGRRVRFRLLIKKVPHGFGSTLLCGLAPLERPTLSALAPVGRFLLQDPKKRSVVLVATGTGLAPFVPMLHELWTAHPATPTWLFYGNRFSDEVVHLKELRLLERVWKNFHFVPIVSRPPPDGSWRGAVGHVQEHVRESLPDLARADAYLCGVNEMVNDMQDLALLLGCPKDRVFVERYGEDADSSGEPEPAQTPGSVRAPA
ncbi:MAG: FAD-dependent oxidoreductase [Euryarchaeota archaeon]|nr:FAD-dependent oxidoreductase [Euryarchaeota archaeon]